MSAFNYQIAKEKELEKSGIPLDTFITFNNHQILLTRESLNRIANYVSQVWKRKLNPDEVKDVLDFIKKLPASKFTNCPLSESEKKLARLYLNHQQVENNLKESELSNDVVRLSHLESLTDRPTIADYQIKELKQMTPSENQFKYAAFADRRGNALVDADRVQGRRSTPDGIKKNGKSDEVDSKFLDKTMLEVLQLIKNFMSPESVDQLLARFSLTSSTYQNINLPHQFVPLDSHYRVLTNSNTAEYTWNIHTAANPGFPGDVKIQDTLHQVIQMKVPSFWIPMLPQVGSFYGRVRMLIKEFVGQSILVAEFLDSTQTEPTIYFYHFEFDITQTNGDRVLLVPVNPIFTFRKPIAQVNTLTISFRTPFVLMNFQTDRDVYTITYGNPTTFTITSNSYHNLSTGDLIYVINSNSANATINTTLTAITGYIVSVISPTQFTIVVDTSALGGTQTGVNVYYGSKRIFFAPEFTTLEQ